jgi:hypothetical protein
MDGTQKVQSSTGANKMIRKDREQAEKRGNLDQTPSVTVRRRSHAMM